MKRNFDEVIKYSVKENVNNIVCPDIDKEYELLKIELRKKKRLITIKTYTSVCALFMVIPIILFIYLNKSENDTNEIEFKNIERDFEINELIENSNLIIYGKVEKVDVDGKIRYVSITIKDILKGITYDNNSINIKYKIANKELFKKDESAIFFITKDNFIREKKCYDLINESFGKYVQKKGADNIFINEGGTNEIDIDYIRSKIFN